MLSEINQAEKDRYHTISLYVESEKKTIQNGNRLIATVVTGGYYGGRLGVGG